MYAVLFSFACEELALRLNKSKVKGKVRQIKTVSLDADVGAAHVVLLTFSSYVRRGAANYFCDSPNSPRPAKCVA